jgi:cyclomaltodextrinase / maltogenic alpha-amylase / neopullulanase
VTVDTPPWVRDAVFYQIFPDRFAASDRVPKPGPLEPWDAPPTYVGFKGGDLLGIVERLPYLQDLGISALYLNPVFQSASNHRYHTYDYFTVDPLLGGDDALRTLVDEVHARDMRIVLDGVFNHTGRGFWAFHHVLETGIGSPYRGWFHFDEGRLAAGGMPQAYPPPGTPSQALGYEAWWGIPALPKLNTSDPQVREYLMTVAEHWLRFGIDGWRLDVPEEINDEGFWQEFRRRCRAVRPDAYLVGEIWRVAPEWVHGDRLDATMDYPLAEAILGFAGGSRLDMGIVRSHNEYANNIVPLDGPGFASRLEDLLEAYDVETVAAQLHLLGSHDTPRMRTVLGDDVTGVRLAMLLQATLPGAPCIYYGDEIGMAGSGDPDCRRAFPWDESRWDHELRTYQRTLLGLRASEPALRADPVVVAGAAGDGVAYGRRLDGTTLVVAVNAGDEAVRLDLALPGEPDGATLESIDLPGADGTAQQVRATVRDGAASVDLGPRSGSILRLG